MYERTGGLLCSWARRDHPRRGVMQDRESKEQAKEHNNERKRTMERATWLSGLGQGRAAGAGSRTYVCTCVAFMYLGLGSEGSDRKRGRDKRQIETD